jgi:hypothetical protein
MEGKNFLIGIITALIFGIALTGTTSMQFNPSPLPIKVFISGGVGCKMAVINDGSETITAKWSVTYWNMGYHNMEGTFDVPPDSAVEKTFPVFSIFSPITASITASNEGLTKNGYIFLFFVVFPD